MQILGTWQTVGHENLAKLEQFRKENGEILQTAGIVALAVMTGALGGALLGKGLLGAKGLAFAKTLLAGQTTASATASATMPAVLPSGIAALTHQATALFNTLAGNALPLTAGAVGGGAVGAGVAQRQVREVKTRLNEQIGQTLAYQDMTTHLQSALIIAQAKVSEWQAASVSPTPSAPTATSAAPADAPPAEPLVLVPDQLELIHGIGPVFAQRLNEAGIFTFADLAAQTPEQLRAILAGVRANRMFDPQAWIAEARQRSVAP